MNLQYKNADPDPDPGPPLIKEILYLGRRRRFKERNIKMNNHFYQYNLCFFSIWSYLASWLQKARVTALSTNISIAVSPV